MSHEEMNLLHLPLVFIGVVLSREAHPLLAGPRCCYSKTATASTLTQMTADPGCERVHAVDFSPAYSLLIYLCHSLLSSPRPRTGEVLRVQHHPASSASALIARSSWQIISTGSWMVRSSPGAAAGICILRLISVVLNFHTWQDQQVCFSVASTTTCGANSGACRDAQAGKLCIKTTKAGTPDRSGREQPAHSKHTS